MQPRSTANRQAWLQRILPATLSVTKKMAPSQIIDTVKLHHKVPITYAAAKRAKKNLLGDDLENQAMKFRLLLAYVDAVCTADPQAHVRLSVEDREGTRRFQRLFICPVLVAELFAIVDPSSPGTEHLQRKSSTLQSRLRRPSMPTTTPSYILACAIVESENESESEFFLIFFF